MNVVTVIGAGVIGTGWAARFLANGYRVRVWDQDPALGDRLPDDIVRLWPRLERFGVRAGASVSNLAVAPSLADACAGATFIQEAVTENLDVKRDVHARIDAVAGQDVIVASSSSGLLPSDVQSAMTRPGRFVVGHPFNPVYLLPLVEVVGGRTTLPATVDSAKTFYASCGMHPLVVRREIEGYLSDRLQEALWREILHLVADGVADTGELDDAIVYGPGLRWALMGTCLTFHLAGGRDGMRHMLEQFGPALALPWTKLEAPELTGELIDRMVSGTSRQAGGKTVDELERVRDDCLIDVMGVIDRYRAQL